MVPPRGPVSALSPLVGVGSGSSGSKCVALADLDTLAVLALLTMSPPENRALGCRYGRLEIQSRSPDRP
jgi:hypothetical protein